MAETGVHSALDLDHSLSDALMKSGLSARQNRLLALVALFQAAQLTHLLAAQGKAAVSGVDASSFSVLLKSSLIIQTQQPNSLFSLDVYPNINDLHLGLRTFETALSKPYQSTRSPMPLPRQYSETFRYAMALIKLEKKLYKNPAFVQRIDGEKRTIEQRLKFFDQNIQHPAIMAALASLYVDTAGQLTPRLAVRGKPEFLKNQAVIDAIRACLFSGLQAAHFWRQLGGTRWQLIFGRKNMLEDLRLLAKLRYQMTNTTSTTQSIFTNHSVTSTTEYDSQ